MKYIKKYESEKSKYTLKDFTVESYWRHKNYGVDSILKIDSIRKGPYSFSNSDYDITYFNYKKNEVKTTKIDDSKLQHIIDHSTNEGYILRPATEEEIEYFNLMLSSEKYNL